MSRRIVEAIGRELLTRLRASPLGGVLSKVIGQTVPVYYDPAYRLPLPAFEGRLGGEPRRADFVAWYCQDEPLLGRCELRTPEPVRYEDLLRVHPSEYLDSLHQGDVLARIFASDPTELPVDEVLNSVRLGCGGTLLAARWVLAHGGAAMNLHGGFHHAAKSHGSGLCVFNDLAVTLAVLRDEGFSGQVVILDLDAHPPDGTADCVNGDPKCFVGSLSGSDWGSLAGVDETVLPQGCGDAQYLTALSALLARLPRPQLALVIAGGDVLAGDRLGCLGLSLAGARERDLRIAAALADCPTVWLPGGGYSEQAWKVLAGTALAVCAKSSQPVSDAYDPLRSRFATIAQDLSLTTLRGGDELTDDDLADLLGAPTPRRRLLDYYTTEGLEYGLSRYGILPFLRRIGYGHFRFQILRTQAGGDTMHLYGRAPDGSEHLLIDCAVEKQKVAGEPVLYIHWLSLRNPLARFSDRRPQLPGQTAPGLGVAREMVEVLGRVASRLNLHGVAYRPAYFHTAYPARHHFRFVTPERQGRFLALIRDLSHLPLLEASTALAEGRVLLCGRTYKWEADEMVYWLLPRTEDDQQVRHVLSECQFTLLPKGS